MVAAFTLLPIGILMLVQVRRGSWGNVDASNARERPIGTYLYGRKMYETMAGWETSLSVRPNTGSRSPRRRT